jgi:flavodoxin
MERKILIVYYSHSGNTKKVAESIKKVTGGTLFEIQPDPAYPADYTATLQQTRKEKQEGYTPALKHSVGDIKAYDIIFVGSPNWFSAPASPVATFLSETDLSDKTVVPFCTHGGGGEAHVLSGIAEKCPSSEVLKGLAVRSNDCGNAEAMISKWLRDINLAN